MGSFQVSLLKQNLLGLLVYFQSWLVANFKRLLCALAPSAPFFL